MAGLNLGRPRDIIKALNHSLATKIEASKIESSRMKLGKIIGQGKRPMPTRIMLRLAGRYIFARSFDQLIARLNTLVPPT